MASTKTLNHANLEALGAHRLAALLLDLSTGDAAIKRRLRLELAGAENAAHEVRKRLAVIAKARSLIAWDRLKALATDLETQHRAIVEQVAPADPRAALDLQWRLIALASPVMGRCDDSNDRIGGVFRGAVDSLAGLAAAAKAAPPALAQRVFETLCDDVYGLCDALIPNLAPALGAPGLDTLKALFTAWAQEVLPVPPESERRVIGWGPGGKMYADDLETRHRDSCVRLALRDIADAQGDVDSFIGQHSAEARTVPSVAAEIGARLLAAGRAADALAAIDAAAQSAEQFSHLDMWDWEEVRVSALIALGREDAAQAFRWACFARGLDARHLRAYLRKLPDFEDIDAEDRAMTLAVQHANVHMALEFTIVWPALDRANTLVIARAAEINGNVYEVLGPAADALDAKYPLAATILRRAMIDYTLEKARASRYKHATRHLAECARSAARISDFGGRSDHAAYVAALKTAHGRKDAFWHQ